MTTTLTDTVLHLQNLVHRTEDPDRLHRLCTVLATYLLQAAVLRDSKNMRAIAITVVVATTSLREGR